MCVCVCVCVCACACVCVYVCVRERERERERETEWLHHGWHDGTYFIGALSLANTVYANVHSYKIHKEALLILTQAMKLPALERKEELE